MNYETLSPVNPSNYGGNSKLRMAIIALLCTSVVLGCAQIRKVTYPQDYVYLEEKQLRSKMALLSLYMRRLDEIQLDASIVSSEQQQRILELLFKVEDLTAEFGRGVTTNHLVIDEHMDEFKIDLHSAIRNARANPPNYFALGQLTGSCTGCHRYRD